jgi:hypothetical protein
MRLVHPRISAALLVRREGPAMLEPLNCSNKPSRVILELFGSLYKVIAKGLFFNNYPPFQVGLLFNGLS